ncbi:hypothetical protein CCP3SC5AM1_30004 [Gammaproteobacteria bacterium]
MPPPLEELRAATEQQSANGRFGFFIPAVEKIMSRLLGNLYLIILFCYRFHIVYKINQ